MNDKDEAAFEKFYNKHYAFPHFRDAADKAWQAACAYKKEEINQADKIIKDRQDELNYLVNKVEELQAENKKQSDDLDNAGNDLFLQEGKIKELEAENAELEKKLSEAESVISEAREHDEQQGARLAEQIEANRILKLNYKDQMVIHLHEKLEIAVEALEKYQKAKVFTSATANLALAAINED